MLWNKLCEGNNQGQHLGIDRIIYLKSGKILAVDEKKRRPKKDKDGNYLEYDDFCLEFKHEGEKYNAPGWIEKDLQIDYLAYAFLPSKRCFILPWQQLRKTWLKNNKNWFNKPYFISKSLNDGYWTYGLCVPIHVVLESIIESMIIKIPMQAKENQEYCNNVKQKIMKKLQLPLFDQKMSTPNIYT